MNFSTHFVIKDFITMTTFSDAFDKEYRRAYRSLFESKNFSDLLCLEDKSPPTRAVYCRRTFDTPTLQPRVPKHLVNSFPWLACEEDINLCGCSVNRSRRVKFPLNICSQIIQRPSAFLERWRYWALKTTLQYPVEKEGEDIERKYHRRIIRIFLSWRYHDG